MINIQTLFEQYCESRQLPDEPLGVTLRSPQIGADVYAPSDLLNIKYIIGNIDMTSQEKYYWAEAIHRHQNSETGRYELSDHRSLYHSSAMAVSALELIDVKPLYSLQYLEPLKDWNNLEPWLESRDWTENPWNGCGHDIPALMAIFAITNAVDGVWFSRLFDWLDERQDPETGMWPKGQKDCLKINHLGAAFHFYFMYEYFGRPILYAEEIVRSTLSLQQSSGSWFPSWPAGFIDLDAVYVLNRLTRVAQHLRGDAKKAIERNWNYTLKRLENDEDRDAMLQDTHATLGTVANISCIMEMLPEQFAGMPKWRQVLDRRPFI